MQVSHQRVAALAAIGHSSGWDMLAGVALACAAFQRVTMARACSAASAFEAATTMPAACRRARCAS